MERSNMDLEGDIELNLILPNTSIVHFTVKKRLPLIDLLVLVASKQHLKPSEHLIQAISEDNVIIRATPNTPVGVLQTKFFQISNKHGSEGSLQQPTPPVAPPRRHVLPNISSTLPPKYKPDVKSVDPQKLLQSYRLQIHLPNNQLHVMRVTPDVTINDVLATVEEAKNLNINNFLVRKKYDLNTVLEYDNTLAHYEIKELILERKVPQAPIRQSRTSIHSIEPSTSSFKDGVKSFFANLKEPVPKSEERIQAVITPMNRPKPPPRKRHAPPPPPVSQSIADDVSAQTNEKPKVTNGMFVENPETVLAHQSTKVINTENDDFIINKQYDYNTSVIQQKQPFDETMLLRKSDLNHNSHDSVATKEEGPKQLHQIVTIEKKQKEVKEVKEKVTDHRDYVDDITKELSCVNQEPPFQEPFIKNIETEFQTTTGVDKEQNNAANLEHTVKLPMDSQDFVESSSQMNTKIRNSEVEIPSINTQVQQTTILMQYTKKHKQLEPDHSDMEVKVEELKNASDVPHSSLRKTEIQKITTPKVINSPSHYDTIYTNSKLANNLNNLSVVISQENYDSKNNNETSDRTALTKHSTIKERLVKIEKPRPVNDQKALPVKKQKPLSKTSSELNLNTSRNTPKFLLTSWSSKNVPKITRIADDSTHGTSAYNQENLLRIDSAIPFTQEIAEEKIKIDTNLTKPTVVSVIRKDRNSTNTVNTQNQNMQPNNPKTHESRPSSTTEAITTPPRIQSWELVNAIEKMFKKNSYSENASIRNSEIDKAGNGEYHYVNEIPFTIINSNPQSGKPSYFEIIAQSESIRSKIPLELSEQSKRSSSESLPLINDYGNGSSIPKNQEAN